jgi:hypothetical protein
MVLNCIKVDETVPGAGGGAPVACSLLQKVESGVYVIRNGPKVDPSCQTKRAAQVSTKGQEEKELAGLEVEVASFSKLIVSPLECDLIALPGQQYWNPVLA